MKDFRPNLKFCVALPRRSSGPSAYPALLAIQISARASQERYYAFPKLFSVDHVLLQTFGRSQRGCLYWFTHGAWRGLWESEWTSPQ